MLRFSWRRFCAAAFSGVASSSAERTSTGNVNDGGDGLRYNEFDHLLSRMAAQHELLFRREGSPVEVKHQARYILSLNVDKIAPTLVTAEQVPVFAAQVAGLVTANNPPTPDFFARLAVLFDHYVADAERRVAQTQTQADSHGSAGALRSPVQLCASIVECATALCGEQRNLRVLPVALHESLRRAHTLGVHLVVQHYATSFVDASKAMAAKAIAAGHSDLSPSSLSVPGTTSSSGGGGGGGDGAAVAPMGAASLEECAPRHILALIKGADVLLGGNDAFVFSRHGVPPIAMLPVKSKHDMERKAAKISMLRELLKALERRKDQITRIDAHVCLRLFAVVGLFNEPIVDACVECIAGGTALSTSIQNAEAISHLGVLGYRHVAVRQIADAVDTQRIGPNGLRKYLRGLAMLQLPLTNLPEIKRVHDHVWMFSMRPAKRHRSSLDGTFRDQPVTLDWHIDVIHALVVLKAPHFKFLVRTCRLVRNEMLRRTGRASTGQVLFTQLDDKPPSPASKAAAAGAGAVSGGVSSRPQQRSATTSNSIDADDLKSPDQQKLVFLTPLQRAQLLCTIGGIKRTAVPVELDKDWVKQVNKVKNALVREAMQTVRFERNPETRSLLWQGMSAVGMSPAEQARKAQEQRAEEGAKRETQRGEQFEAAMRKKSEDDTDGYDFTL